MEADGSKFSFCLPTVVVEDVSRGDEAIEVLAVSNRRVNECPDCGTPSRRVHSRYVRSLRDLPLQGVPVVLRLSVSKFFCDEICCHRRVFCERLHEVAGPYKRVTERLRHALRSVALLVGGEPGYLLCSSLSMQTSADTLLRVAREGQRVTSSQVRVLGVDDFAFRKRHRYGTVLVDLERRRVVELLPDRTTQTLTTWLRAHPEVQVIVRDRYQPYARACYDAAPQAIQVLDRWHLLKNLAEAVDRVVKHQ